MSPVAWTLDQAPPGMTIDGQTGVVSWASPVESPFLYVIVVRATNGAGTVTQQMFLGVGPVPCPGDVDGDGSVTLVDFSILASNFGQSVPPNTGGDFTGDGEVTLTDFAILASDFGCEP